MQLVIVPYLLTRLCKFTPSTYENVGVDDPLRVLRREYPDLVKLVTGRRVLDFGCGWGYQTAALHKLGAEVVGLDTNAESIAKARELHPGVEFAKERTGKFDIVVSQNAMEHFDDPAGVLDAMKASLAPGGKILITFGPPWYAPAGSHMGYFCPIPWANLLFPEKALLAERAKYIKDGATRYEEVTSGLNKMSVAKFERLIKGSGLKLERKHYRTVKGVPLLGSIPILRELFINHVTVILTR